MSSTTVIRPTATPQPVPSGTAVRCGWNGTAVAMFAVAAVFHLIIVVVVHWQTNGQAMFPDARGYNSVSSTIAMVWRGGTRPHIRDLAEWSGSELWGYPAVMALCKVATGGGWLAAKAVLALVAATGAAAAYSLAITSQRGHRRAVVAALGVGVSPTLLLWDAWGLKDGLIAALALWTLLLQTRARFWLACIGTLLAIQACLYLRPATALFLAVALLARIRFRRGYLLGLLIVATVAAVYVLPRLTDLFNLMDSLEIQSGTPLGFTGGYGSTNLLDHPQYLVIFLFGPFPWAFGPGTAGPERWLYLGTTIWIACLALAPASLRKAWADSVGVGRAAILASAAYAAAYLDTFGAAFYRQRSLLECMLFLLVALYLPASPAAAMTRVRMWLGVVAGLAVLQSPDLTPTLSSKALAAGGMSAALLLVVRPAPAHRLAQRMGSRRKLPFPRGVLRPPTTALPAPGSGSSRGHQ